MLKVSVIIPVYNMEKYIEKMLLSVKQQSFDAFEAILVNDGSTDRSLEIIEKCISNDSRFKVIDQMNLGVSAARNRGLDEAVGEYVIFFDGDDYIPENSIAELYRSITKTGCDMAVGKMMLLNDGILSTNRATKELASKISIEPTDKGFIKSWSQCNKLYRKEFLNENNIRFIDVKVAEDGHFQYQVLSKIKKICGCNHTVYHYIRRPSWNSDKSASKMINFNMLQDRLTVYENMLSYVEDIFENKPITGKKSYMDDLLTRFISDSFCQTFYRRVWQCDDKTLNKLSEALNFYRPKISDDAWSAIVRKQWDIDVEKRLSDSEEITFKDVIIDEPIVSFILADYIPKNMLDITLNSLFGQAFPSFEVVIGKKAAASLEDKWKLFPNIKIREENEKDELINLAIGEYVCIVDSPAIFNTNGLKKMVDILHFNNGLDFIATYMKKAEDNNSITSSLRLYCMDTVYGHRLCRDRKRKQVNSLDNLFVNKIFRKTAISKYAFSGNDAEDMMDIYNKMKFEKTRGVNILTFTSNDVFIERSNDNVKRISMMISHRYNRVIGDVIVRRMKIFLDKAVKAKTLFRSI